MAPRGKTAGQVEAHAYMHAKGVPQLLDSVITELLVERPDDPIGFMQDMLRKASAGVEGAGTGDGKETPGDEAGAAGAVSASKSAGSLRVHAEFRDASGASTQTHVHRVSAARCGRAKLLGWCDEAREALQELVGVASEPGGGVGPDQSQRRTEGRVAGADVDAVEDAARARKVQMMAAMLASLGCGEVLARSILPDAAEGDMMTVLAQLSQEKIAELFQAAAVDMAVRVGDAVEAWTAGTNAAVEADANGKFVDGKYGSLELFDTGLEGLVGLPDVHVLEAMIWEHASTEKFTPSNNKGTRP